MLGFRNGGYRPSPQSNRGFEHDQNPYSDLFHDDRAARGRLHAGERDQRGPRPGRPRNVILRALRAIADRAKRSWTALRGISKNHLHDGRRRITIVNYRDPAQFPRFGGDEFDPPPYRRRIQTPGAAMRPRPNSMQRETSSGPNAGYDHTPFPYRLEGQSQGSR